MDWAVDRIDIKLHNQLDGHHLAQLVLVLGLDALGLPQFLDPQDAVRQQWRIRLFVLQRRRRRLQGKNIILIRLNGVMPKGLPSSADNKVRGAYFSFAFSNGTNGRETLMQNNSNCGNKIE